MVHGYWHHVSWHLYVLVFSTVDMWTGLHTATQCYISNICAIKAQPENEWNPLYLGELHFFQPIVHVWQDLDRCSRAAALMFVVTSRVRMRDDTVYFIAMSVASTNTNEEHLVPWIFFGRYDLFQNTEYKGLDHTSEVTPLAWCRPCRWQSVTAALTGFFFFLTFFNF